MKREDEKDVSKKKLCDICDFSVLREEGISRRIDCISKCNLRPPSEYQKMKKIYNVSAYVVNVHDATNFDIDFTLPKEVLKKYKSVVSNEYTFVDLDGDFFQKPLSQSDYEISHGVAYRCHLMGVGVVSGPNVWKKYSQETIKIRQLIDRADGWVECTLSDIDIYNRLLVQITVKIDGKVINLRDLLLGASAEQGVSVFCEYKGSTGRF